MIRFSRLFSISVGAFFGALLSGCTLSIPQLESAVAIAQGMIESEEESSTNEPATWVASIYGKGAVLNPYVSNNLIVFANEDGDAIAFDGWIIRSVVGFGLHDPVSISGKDGVRTFSYASQISSTECGEWSLNGSVWRQTCAAGDGRILLNDAGNIELISMSLGESLGIVTLRVVK